MHIKLLNIILTIIAAGLITSCSSDDPSDDSRIAGPEMKFVVSDASRTSALTNIGFPDSRFIVYGEKKFENDNYAPSMVFDNTVVRYSDGEWVYDGAQYWFPRHEYSFTALYPIGVGDPSYSNSTLSLSYTLPDYYASTTDIMAATYRRLCKNAEGPTAEDIRLEFFHILSRINFKIENDAAADILTVNEIKLEGVNRTGSYAFTPAPLLSGATQTNDYESSWTGISNQGTINAHIDIKIPENETRPLFPDDDMLLMIPQPENNDVILSITYTLHDEGMEEDEILTLQAETPIGGWNPGKVYTYSLSISEITKEIQLTVKVNNWQKPGSSDITVPAS